MKKLAIIMALMLVQTQVIAATENTVNTNQSKEQVATQAKEQKQQAQPKKDEEYLLKYNIRDLEAAPWLHDGKRSYN